LAKLPDPFAGILTRALAPRPENRFPNALSFAEALAPYAGDGSTRLGMLVAELFGDELAEERQHLSANSRGGTGAGGSSGTMLSAGSTPIASNLPASLRSN
jgi:hypothetical protein